MKSQPSFWKNGKLLSVADQDTWAIQDQGLLRGWGIFETLLAVTHSSETEVPWFDRHMKRLLESCEKLELPKPSPKDILHGIDQTIANKETGAQKSFSRVRITLTAGQQGTQWWEAGDRPNLLISAVEIPQPAQNPITACFFPDPLPSNGWTSGHKTINYLPYLLATRYAKRNDTSEAILCNEKNEIIEGATTNLFIVKQDQIITPPLSAGCLPGTTREFVLETAEKTGIPLKEQSLTKPEFLNSDAVFATSAIGGIRTITQTANQPSSTHPVIKQLQKEFSESLLIH